MRSRVALVLVFGFLALTAEAIIQTPWAQQRQQQAAPAPAAPDSEGMQSGMCPMMAGGMMNMMGGQMDSPRTMQMRGEMLKAMGELMIKHGKMMESAGK